MQARLPKLSGQCQSGASVGRLMERKTRFSHDKWMIEELHADPKLAAEYLRQAMTDMSEPECRGAAKLPLRRLAEAHGGMAAVAMEAGIQRESLYRALSPKGNPTMNTLIAVLKSLGMRLTVEPDKKQIDGLSNKWMKQVGEKNPK